MLNRHDLRDEEWERLRPLSRLIRLVAAVGLIIAGPSTVFWRSRTGCPWRDMPTEYGLWQTVYKRHNRWSTDGTWSAIVDHLRAGCDEAEGTD